MDTVEMRERRAEPGELCTCGRQAVNVFLTSKFGEVGWCGISDGGAASGPCPFCGAANRHGPVAGTATCPQYQLRPQS